MASSYSPSLKLELIGNGDQSGTWGTTTNNNLGTLLEQAITGVQSITMSNSDYTLSNYNGTSDEARNAVLFVSGTNSDVRKIVAPQSQNKLYTIYNNTTGGYAITIGAPTGTAVTIPSGVTATVFTDGANFYSAQTGSAGNFNVNGTLTASGVTDTGPLSAASLSVSGVASLVTGSISGIMTAPTASAGTNTTQLATTAFVATATGSLGTMASQNANAVAITGGTINGVTGTASGLTVGTATNATNATNPASGGSFITSSNIASQSVSFATNATNATNITNSGGWSVTPSGTTLYFNYNGTNVAKLDSSGNLTTKANVTAYGTV
jgi:hypothetical protein